MTGVDLTRIDGVDGYTALDEQLRDAANRLQADMEAERTVSRIHDLAEQSIRQAMNVPDDR